MRDSGQALFMPCLQEIYKEFGMKKIDRLYVESKKTADAENIRALKKIQDDPMAQTKFALDKFIDYLSVIPDFIAVCTGPEDEKKTILEKTAVLKEAVKGFVARL
jgi:hypothetical protein